MDQMSLSAEHADASPEDAAPVSASAVSTTTVSAFTLRVGGLPCVLSDDAVTALLSHFGATRVRVLRRKKAGAVLHGVATKVTATAIAQFATRERLLGAQQRLAKVQLAGTRLTVHVVLSDDEENGKEVESAEAGDHGETDSVVETVAAAPPLEKKLLASGQAMPFASATAPSGPVPLAPHLGLHYAPSPFLQYKYPKASVPVVRNIANALIALPRFYTQVLHLMNKMNLPTPFEPGAIPGRFSEEYMPEQQRQRPSESTDQQIVEEDDDEEEDTDVKEPMPVTGKKRPRHAISQSSAAAQDPSRSSQRSDFTPPRPNVISSAELEQQRLPAAVRARDTAFAGFTPGAPACRVRVHNIAASVEVKDLQYVFGHVLPREVPLGSMKIERNTESTFVVVEFPTLQSARQAVSLINGVVVDGQPLVVCYDDADAGHPPHDTTGPADDPAALAVSPAISILEDWERMELTQLAQEKAMKNYQRGEPTPALYIKNLAKAVDEHQLRSLCRSFLPPSEAPGSLTIRHFTEGRMKNQAFIEFPRAETATAVLESIHGLIVHGKPLVVSFRKAQSSQPPATTEQG